MCCLMPLQRTCLIQSPILSFYLCVDRFTPTSTWMGWRRVIKACTICTCVFCMICDTMRRTKVVSFSVLRRRSDVFVTQTSLLMYWAVEVIGQFKCGCWANNSRMWLVSKQGWEGFGYQCHHIIRASSNIPKMWLVIMQSSKRKRNLSINTGLVITQPYDDILHRIWKAKRYTNKQTTNPYNSTYIHPSSPCTQKGRTSTASTWDASSTYVETAWKCWSSCEGC